MASLNLTRFSDEGPNQVGQFVIKEWVERSEQELDDDKIREVILDMKID